MTPWNHFNAHFLRYDDLGFSMDTSRMLVNEAFFQKMTSACETAYAAMQALEKGAIANKDEGRRVGHYWLRAPVLAPSEEIRQYITTTKASIGEFATAVADGRVCPPNKPRFTHLLVVGIGGSALGPQLVADALAPAKPSMAIDFLDNTDPDGMDRVLARLPLERTLVLVISKSGGTKETANGMLETQAAFAAAGLPFPKHAVAVTGAGSHLDSIAEAEGWVARFPMSDWVGGRTSVMSVVGLLPMALQGLDMDGFLEGAAIMDRHTRIPNTATNAAMQLALMWFAVGEGKGTKDMVILPYKDRLVLFSKYLQQLVMESLGKELDLDGKQVNQGIAVYGNKGSTDQHAYIQQLRDGVANFFATFIEVREGRDGPSMKINDEGATSADYLQGFLRGTREALSENGRPSMTLSIPRVDAGSLGALIGLFERAVGYYATLVNINAYHQPGVEAGKKAAEEFIALLHQVRHQLSNQAGRPFTAEALATILTTDGEHPGITPESVYHALTHLAANAPGVSVTAGTSPAEDAFQLTS